MEQLQYIKGIGPKRAELLALEGFASPKDLLLHFPISYISRDSSKTLKEIISSLNESAQISNFGLSFGKEHSLFAKVYKKEIIKKGPKKSFLVMTVVDINGDTVKINFWNRGEFYDKKYKIGQQLFVSGKIEKDKYGYNFSHPEIEIAESDDANNFIQGKVLPKYSISDKLSKAGFSHKVFRTAIADILEKHKVKVNERLPSYILESNKLIQLSELIPKIHFPENSNQALECFYRLKFEEIFYFQLKLNLLNKNNFIHDTAPKLLSKGAFARKVYESLPFKLTTDQKITLKEIAVDFKSGYPMNRLLQGDVGSGKTIVALLSMLIAYDCGYQSLILAPTELLAEQHFRNFQKLLEPHGIEISLITGGIKQSIKNQELEKIASGQVKIIIGTHALFYDSLKYNNLAFIVIDEQHRFGVEQRAKLRKMAKDSEIKDGEAPHILVMSATPIPRTIALTAYADLDVSTIKTKPATRKEIITKIAYSSQIEEIMYFLKNELDSGRQAYIVYPLVEKSEELNLKSAVEHFEFLETGHLKDYNVALLHGQMKSQEKDEVMKKFLTGEYQVLVATTVIEVGIDVPNASVMLIENAERFGLAQLHQLRGRVGRGQYQSYCILMADEKLKWAMRKGENSNLSSIARLQAIASTNDGFEIANEDLKIRGAGDILGTRQAGMPNLKYIDLINDEEIIEKTLNLVRKIIADDPELILDKNKLIKHHLNENFDKDLIKVG